MNDEQLEQPEIDAPDPSPEAPEPPAPADGSGWAAYDDTLKRFVGPVVAKKPTTAELNKLGPKSHKITARRV